ncbi:PBECR2 nuclease fold domain-containing protein [Clostridium sp.]|uniref:PBECR3 domain-containing polyvalent protein n=1 Tax=Clostridium sp. TaxID=1506 RepID=UPI0028FE5CB9|nr:PBECR2 nuclease fold domain-containing protein [Clostridium sp.]MDU1228360.1 PBECR2 nuclease fold domain-containing protein [Clostridium sp.]MDU7667475.1 PBECR2 nuclease fold domain-containing protein [Escherichia coli]MDU7700452.1 PBECR2 nuclease fold domain-containing protein [Escherichia coli]
MVGGNKVHNKPKMIGRVSKFIIDKFGLDYKINQEIYIGESNRKHMIKEHPEDYEKYGDKIEYIIANPDFIAKHPTKSNSSIEYIKVFKDENEDYVLVAVRATGGKKLFARTLFVMDPEKVDKYVNVNALIPYKDE